MAFTLAVIGGSGFSALSDLTHVESLELDTPFGKPSSTLIRGWLGNTRLLFLTRHGQHHRIPPHAINYRANICALKLAGATHVLSVSAVGSMRESMHPGDVVIVRDYIDCTRRRVSTFFDSGLVAHVSMAVPVCSLLADAAYGAAQTIGARAHDSGTYLCIEGPQFSTRAESRLYRTWGVDVIGMTAMPEAKLAREAELPYATAAFVTDFDCWNDSEVAVSVDQINSTLVANAGLARRLISELAGKLPDPRLSPAFGALRTSLVTAPEHADALARESLGWLLDATKEPATSGGA